MFATIFNLLTNELIIVLRATAEVEYAPFARFVHSMQDEIAEEGTPTWMFIHHGDIPLEIELEYVGKEHADLIRKAVGI